MAGPDRSGLRLVKVWIECRGWQSVRIRSPLPGQFLSLGDLGGAHLPLQPVPIEFGFFKISAWRQAGPRQVQPFMSLDEVLRNPSGFAVHDAKIVLGFGIALLGGFFVPLHRFPVILYNPAAGFINESEIVLCFRLI